ncbi:MAG: hypothetical protein MUD01_05075 [Chloroflexaceae bacterium]|nr:hypothetical protein [Chloroflexaceae bacterium]
MERIALLHGRLQVTLLLVMVALTLWGLVNGLRNLPATSNYRAGLWVGQLLMIANSLLGLILLFTVAQPLRLAVHIVYAVAALGCLPAAALFARQQEARWQSFTLAGTCFFLVGMMTRMYETAVGG